MVYSLFFRAQVALALPRVTTQQARCAAAAASAAAAAAAAATTADYRRNVPQALLLLLLQLLRLTNTTNTNTDTDTNTNTPSNNNHMRLVATRATSDSGMCSNCAGVKGGRGDVDENILVVQPVTALAPVLKDPLSPHPPPPI